MGHLHGSLILGCSELVQTITDSAVSPRGRCARCSLIFWAHASRSILLAHGGFGRCMESAQPLYTEPITAAGISAKPVILQIISGIYIPKLRPFLVHHLLITEPIEPGHRELHHRPSSPRNLPHQGIADASLLEVWPRYL